MIVYRIPQPIAAPAPRHARATRTTLAADVKTGTFAGAVMFGVLLLLAVTLYDESPWKLVRMIAAMALGPGALDPEWQPDVRILAAAVALQLGMAITAAVALAGALARWRALPPAAMGLAFGAVLYGVVLYGIALAFPWLAELRSADTLLVSLLFGLLATPAAD